MTDPIAAMAAAVAAAAEIAQNSGIYLYDDGRRGVETSLIASPMMQAALHQENATKQFPDAGVSNSFIQGTTASPVMSPSVAPEEQASMPLEEDAEKRLARSRERNREHARRTRLRKKAQLESLQSRVKGLEAESRVLKQSIEDCSIASILIGLSSSDEPAESLLDAAKLSQELKSSPKVSMLVGKRKRFLTEESVEQTPQPLKLNIDGHITFIGGGKTHINWKSGVYCDENGVQQQLTKEQLESLRRERNRLHAKMTRDRKKNFVSHVEKTIEKLESENKRMRDTLSKVAKNFSKTVTPLSSPTLSPVLGDFTHAPEPSVTPDPNDEASGTDAPSLPDAAVTKTEPVGTPPLKRPRVTHGFHLIA